MRCCFAHGGKDDNEKLEVQRNIQYVTSHSGMNVSQLAHSTHDTSCCVQPQVAGNSNCPAICLKSVGCCLSLAKDTLKSATAETS